MHVVVPDGIDDPARPSGGNVYDRRICARLGGGRLGGARAPPSPGRGRSPTRARRRRCPGIVAGLPDDAVVLVDGLIASAAPGRAGAAGGRLRAGRARAHAARRRAVRARRCSRAPKGRCSRPPRGRSRPARGRGTGCSTGTRLRPGPGARRPAGRRAAAARARLAPAGARCSASPPSPPHKGHDVLLAALAELADLPWRCTCVGSLDRDPAFADGIRRRRTRGRDRRSGDLRRPADRRTACHARTPTPTCWCSRPARETYGMVVTEALARGVPVIASRSAACPRRWAARATAAGPACWCRRTTRARSAAALRALARPTPNCAHGSGRPPGSVVTALPGWAETTDRRDRVLELARRELAGR